MRIEIVFLIIVATFSTILNNNSTEAFSIYWSPPGLYSPERTIQNKPVTSEIKQNYCRFLEGHKFIFGYKLCFAILLKKLKSSLKKENLPRRNFLVSTITKPSPTKNPAIFHALRPLYYRVMWIHGLCCFQFLDQWNLDLRKISTFKFTYMRQFIR